MPTTNNLMQLDDSKPPSLDGGLIIQKILTGDLGSTGGIVVNAEKGRTIERIAKIGDDNSVFDVAACILAQTGQIAVSKLQLLLYYSQAWSLVWDDMPAFSDIVLAGPNGPFIERVRTICLGLFQIDTLTLGASERVVPNIRQTCEVVVKHYNEYTSQELIFLAQSESPWKIARGHSVSSTNPPISTDDMISFYRNLLNTNG